MVLKEILRQIRPEPEREPPLPPQRHYEPPSKGTLPAARMKPYRGLPMTLGNAAAAGSLEQATTW